MLKYCIICHFLLVFLTTIRENIFINCSNYDSNDNNIDCNNILKQMSNYNSSCWLLGETPVTGLSNQITAAYSYIPIAKLFSCHLIVGEMYSRKNFEITMKQFDQEKDGLLLFLSLSLVLLLVLLLP